MFAQTIWIAMSRGFGHLPYVFWEEVTKNQVKKSIDESKGVVKHSI